MAATGQTLVHWLTSQQLPAEAILRHLDWKEAVRLSASCSQLWPHVEWLVTLAQPNQKAALNKETPDRLRIPLLTGLTLEQVRVNHNHTLRWACKNGHLAVAQWLAERFGLTADDARENDNWALLEACHQGHLAVAQWLAEQFQLTADDARGRNNEVLRWACNYGHLAVAQWLADRFGLTAADARAVDNSALRGACENGHLAVAQWLETKFGITQEEINE